MRVRMNYKRRSQLERLGINTDRYKLLYDLDQAFVLRDRFDNTTKVVYKNERNDHENHDSNTSQ